MNRTIHLKTRIPSFFISLTLLCAAFGPKAFGVSPAPDGGYPGLNTAEGQKALFNLTAGTGNTAVGWFSLESVTTGSFNTGVGAGSLVLNSGDQNTATGVAALLLNTTGSSNTANGALALLNNTTGFDNTATGSAAMYSNVDGNDNVAIGFRALQNHTTGNSNVAIGVNSMLANTSGNSNVAIGVAAMLSAASGDNNIAIGTTAGGAGTASNTIHIGFGGIADDTNGRIRIGQPGIHTSTYITGINGVNIVSGALPVYVDANNQLGTAPSSRRFKTDITNMAASSEAILSMRPVTFHFKTHNSETHPPTIPQFGLIAEEVAEINPDLVVRDVAGEIYTVRYEAINAMLLNEFLKEHLKVQEQEAGIKQLKSTVSKQEATIAQQQKGMEALAARLNEQAAEIQKVSVQLELQQPPAQTVFNNQR